jgi:hypothetical protein
MVDFDERHCDKEEYLRAVERLGSPESIALTTSTFEQIYELKDRVDDAESTALGHMGWPGGCGSPGFDGDIEKCERAHAEYILLDEALELACEKYGALLKVEVDCDSYLPSDIADSLEQVFIQCDAEDARKLESIKDKLDQAGCKHRIVKAGQLGF